MDLDAGIIFGHHHLLAGGCSFSDHIRDALESGAWVVVVGLRFFRRVSTDYIAGAGSEKGAIG